KRRKDERIDINAESIRKIGLVSKNAILFVDEVPRKCIIRDLSFSGAMILVTGVGKFLVDKDAKLSIEIEDRANPVVLKSKIVRFEEYPDQKGIGTVAIGFYEEEIPMAYKMRINDYLNTSRKHN
ncbi:MAG: PilZ domain-containing protein, partial [Spirochaetales bacterium]|nr:PilZ domain-containing protein [Spirochaetales bacterium]